MLVDKLAINHLSIHLSRRLRLRLRPAGNQTSSLPLLTPRLPYVFLLAQSLQLCQNGLELQLF